jgi:hypothetical protein
MFGRSASIRRFDVRATLRRTAYFVPLLWLAGVVSGLAVLEVYKARPGISGRTPTVLPQFDAGAEWSDRGRPVLLMFVHPHCPCTQASLGELAEILAREPGKSHAVIVFVNPPGAEADWSQTALRKKAATIPNLRLVDDDGTLARQFGAETSGHVVLYDTDGKLVFSGGITRSRGHEGESPGRRAICARLEGTASDAPAETPVFGCPLFTSGACAGTQCSADRTGKLP